METKANYVLIGAFTIIASLGLLMFGLWSAKFSSDRTWQRYQIIFSEAVTGLSVGSPVQYNGISVGSVTRLSIAPDDPSKVIAQVQIESGTPIKVDTRARLAITSVTGPTIIQLSGGSPDTPALTSVDKRDLPVIQTAPSALQNIADTAGRLVERLDQLLSDQNVAEISTALSNLSSLSDSLADKDHGVETLLVSIRDASQQLNATLATTNGTIQRLDQNVIRELPGVVGKLESTLSKIDSAAGNADALLGENRAAFNSFANDGLAQLGPTLTELRNLTRDLRRIMDRMESNPRRFLLGRDVPKEFEPE
ncbi:MAG: MCE family protein [Xanthomonadaceae bacterium]|jgi:phospholipid/cholesterol/gamma-HCH transport system substrate-binding protein|nr:MCE family protein [Xanthomonadaceae bacterium]